MNKQTENLWTIEDVAEFLQVKPSVVKYWIYSRDIPYIKIGKFYRFDPVEIKEWVNNRKIGININNDKLYRIQ